MSETSSLGPKELRIPQPCGDEELDAIFAIRTVLMALRPEQRQRIAMYVLDRLDLKIPPSIDEIVSVIAKERQ